MEYIQVLNGLQDTLNTPRKKGIEQEFKHYIGLLKSEFGQEISTKFLRGLIIGKSNREKTHRVNYLLKKANLKTEKRSRYFQEWVFSKYQTEVTIYAHTKGIIYKDILNGLTEEEQNLRNSINKGGGVCVKDVYYQTIGKDNLSRTQQEVLFFIKI